MHGACRSLSPAFLSPGMKIISYPVSLAFAGQEISPSTERSCFLAYVVPFNTSAPLPLLFCSWKVVQGCVGGGINSSPLGLFTGAGSLGFKSWEHGTCCAMERELPCIYSYKATERSHSTLESKYSSGKSSL